MPTRRDWPTYASRSVHRGRRYSSYELTQSLRRGCRGTRRRIGSRAVDGLGADIPRTSCDTVWQVRGAVEWHLPRPAESDVELPGLPCCCQRVHSGQPRSHRLERAFFSRTAAPRTGGFRSGLLGDADCERAKGAQANARFARWSSRPRAGRGSAAVNQLVEYRSDLPLAEIAVAVPVRHMRREDLASGAQTQDGKQVVAGVAGMPCRSGAGRGQQPGVAPLPELVDVHAHQCRGLTRA